MMGDVDVERLRAAAEAAGGCGMVMDCADPAHEWYGYGELAERLSGGLRTHEAAEFVAVCKPATVLALLDRLGAAEATVARVAALADEWEDPRPKVCGTPADAAAVLRAALGGAGGGMVAVEGEAS